MKRIRFETHPDNYKHWKLEFDGPVARLNMQVAEDEGLLEGYKLKLNSYDLGVDIELADAIDRIRFEHPEVKAVLITSLLDRIFCAGANIFMLGQSPHGFKVNFCKFTNETRLGIEDASENSGLKFLAALNGTCAGGGYELALACDEIYLVDDGNSAVSLPEVPLLGVLPGTGGLTRVTDKRKVRRDRADFFSTVADGIKGSRAVEWGFVDGLYPKSKFEEVIGERLQALAAQSDRPGTGPGITLSPLEPERDGDETRYRYVTMSLDREHRIARVNVAAPGADEPATPGAVFEAGDAFWALRAFRELNDALLDLRINEEEMGTIILTTSGDAEKVLAVDRTLADHADHWLVREIIHYVKRTLKRLDLTAKSIVALIEPGACFAGTLFELALAADRSYMMDDPEDPPSVWLSPMNAGPLKMSNGLTRLETRFLADPAQVEEVLAHAGPFGPTEAEEAGLVTFAPDDIDWEDDVRLGIEERVSLSPDALTGMEANLRFAGPETLETKIFGRLTAWQNWIFQRPNAVGERGALKVYGQAGLRPDFDWRRT
jgi:benzoyl-CoA-dihydrodiol lyase